MIEDINTELECEWKQREVGYKMLIKADMMRLLGVKCCTVFFVIDFLRK